MCGHHILSAVDKIAENSFFQYNNQDYEIEADYFAATLLSPLPLFKVFEIQSSQDIQKTFGLSATAADIRLKEYKLWIKNHRKTAWENDIVNVVKYKTLQ